MFDDINRPSVTKKPWMEDVELILATEDMLDQIAEECIAAVHFGLDLETTGLDQRAFPTDSGKLETVDKIVGYCLAPSRDKGYYIPVRHRDKGAESNIPPRLAVALINKIQAAGGIAIFHNAKFDQKFLAHDSAGAAGEWDDPKKWHDTLLLAYLRNPRERRRGLKYLAGDVLKREMIELEDLFLAERGKKVNKDFSTLEPTWGPTVWYAAADATNTLALFEEFLPLIMEKDKFGNSQKTIYTIEKICITATIWMEQCRIHIDRDKLVELIRLGQKEWWDCINEVYTAVSEALKRDMRPPWLTQMAKGFDPNCLSPDYMEIREKSKGGVAPDSRPLISKSVPSLLDPKIRETVQFPASYDVTIPAELGSMLRELGVRGLEATEKSGQVKTSKDVLERVIEEAGEQYLWMAKVKRFREISKALGNVLFNLYRDSSPERSPDGCVWANFKGTGTDTGRFSTPTPRASQWSGQANWNVQSTTATYDKSLPECSRRQRECISARPDHILFAIDYSGVELRIVTNMSLEPKWVTEFFRCATCEHEFERDDLPPPFCPECGSDKIGDLHSLTAVGIYGMSDKLKRQIGKIVNFLLCYGGSGSAVMRSTGCDKEEGWRIKNQFDKTYRGLLRWWKSQHKLAKVQKYVTTAFGRKYPVPDIDHEYGKFRSKAERNAVNGPVQGTSADIMKLAMGLIYRECKKRGWICRGPGLEDLVKMTITIHDELVFEIHESIVAEAIPIIERIMCVDTVKNLGWIVQLKVDIEFGDDWTVKNNLTEMTFNKGGGSWTPHLASIFPDRYASYLNCGGTPIGLDVDIPPSPLPPPNTPPAPPDSVAAFAEIPANIVVTTTKPTEEQARAVARSDGGIHPPHQETYTRTVRTEKDGDDFVFRISRSQMTPESAETLARVVKRCIGRGVDVLWVKDEEGNDLLGGPVRVAREEFTIVARYEGL